MQRGRVVQYSDAFAALEPAPLLPRDDDIRKLLNSINKSARDDRKCQK